MSTLNLGKIRFNWTGAYNNSTAYVANDVVSSGGNSYICKLASTGNAVSNGTYWDLMSQAGTNGTDLTSTLTAQGDIVYRDGSGLQKLAKPASDKFLKNTSGGVVSWADAGGGAWTKISSTTLTGTGVSEIEFTGIDTSSTYQTYVFVLADVGCAGNAKTFSMQPASASNTYGWNMQYHNRCINYDSDDRKGMVRGTSTDGVDLANGANLSNEGYYSAIIYLTDGRVKGGGAGAKRPQIWGTYSMNHHVANTIVYGSFYGGYNGAPDFISKVRFKPSSDNLTRGTYTMYGIKTT